MPQILVVDDDRAAREALCKRLDHSGFETLKAANGHEAIAQFDAHHPQVVLLDASMPDMNGFDVCRHIRAEDPNRNTRVIFLTGASTPSPDYVERCVEASECDGCLRKPYDIAELMGLLQEILAPRHFVGA